uniref:Trehalase n=1 Tax=Heterorhabditis bacteriophora TaxID=37862 RepID=A0A1I7WUE3_HETBA
MVYDYFLGTGDLDFLVDGIDDEGWSFFKFSTISFITFAMNPLYLFVSLLKCLYFKYYCRRANSYLPYGSRHILIRTMHLMLSHCMPNVMTMKMILLLEEFMNTFRYLILRLKRDSNIYCIYYRLPRKWLLHGYQLLISRLFALMLSSAGGGGEYEVQTGFGWTNGVILDLLDKYGEKMDITADSSASSTFAFLLLEFVSRVRFCADINDDFASFFVVDGSSMNVINQPRKH